MQTLNLTNFLQKRFIGADELRRQLTEILIKLPKEGGEIVVTRHGKPQAVLVDLESYLELQEQLADADSGLIKDTNEAIADVKARGGKEAAKVFKDLGL